MLAPALPSDEPQRLEALRSLQLLDSAPEERFDTLTRVAARVFGVPISVVTLVDERRQWFKSCLGLEVSETAREISFCGHAILSDELFVVEDAAHDPRFADNPLVTGPPRIRFYAGVPLRDGACHRLGSFAIIDSRPRTLTESDRVLLRDLARLVELELERIRVWLDHEAATAELRRNEARLLEQETRLREADQQKDRFLATLAHELRNPLAPIRNSVHLARLSRPKEPAVQRAVEVIDRQSMHLTRLVDDLLEVARFTQGRLTLDRRLCRVDELAREALDAVAPAAEAAGHRVHVDLGEESLWVDADPTRLVQALQNLLHNAIKYTDPGGTVSMQARADAELVEITVADTGVGIAAEQFERLFEPFAQDQRALRRRGGGLGIGLALARQLIEMHGGRLVADSAGPGHGARFVVSLRRRAPSGTSSAVKADEPETGLLRILVVDDNLDLLGTLQGVLEAEGHEVLAAATGRQAITMALASRPDVVVLDIGLPDIDGNDVARELRRRLGDDCPALLAVTGWGQEADRRRSAEAGFVRHLTKPVDPTTLREVISDVAPPSTRPGR